MAEEETEYQLTDAEIAEFAQKIGQWGEGLTAKERAFLMDIVSRAAATSSDDVQGYVMNSLVQFEGLAAGKKGCKTMACSTFTPENFRLGMSQLLPRLG
jgi:hypothetical protein